MPVVTSDNIQVDALSEPEAYALDILQSLPEDKFNHIKDLMELDIPGVVGPTTLTKFIELTNDCGFTLTEAGVNSFKESHELGNDGPLRGVIGPQTAEVYYDEILAKITPATQSGSRRINKAGLQLVKEFEGLARRLPDGRIAAYLDAVGIPTIGYGHTKDVQIGQMIDVKKAEAFLLDDLEVAESGVENLVKVSLSDNQFSALVSFAFNVGTGALARSTLLKQLNRGNYKGAADQFLRWVRAGGRKLPGLVRRRQAERKLFLS
jgi:GH24 family phage-related lysozyme (muramidase)